MATIHQKSTVPNYSIKGRGERKVIVLHDWMGDAEGNWRFAFDFLDVESFSYAFVDVRVYGKSRNLHGDFTLDEIVADIFSVADALNWEKFYLAGHSMCGMAAQKAVLHDTDDRIKAVVALTPVSSAGFPVDEETKGFSEAMIVDLDMATTGYGMLVSDKLPKKWNRQRAERWHRLTNKQAVRSYMSEWLTKDFFEETKGIKKPFLVIYGEDDLEKWRLEGQKEAFRYFENVQMEGVANADHYPMQQVPAYTVQLVESWLFKN